MTRKAVAAALEEKQCVLELVQWTDAGGAPRFTYLLMKKTRLEEFRHALATRDVDLEEFGVIVAYGAGNEPPPGYEEEVLAAIRKVA